MVQTVIALLAITVPVSMSRRADHEFRHLPKLPMQWLPTGEVNWTAPRRVALAFTPILATCILVAVVISTFVLAPRPGQEADVVPAVLFIAASFVAVHAFHLWIIRKMIREIDC